MSFLEYTIDALIIVILALLVIHWMDRYDRREQ